jgi:hypothetical protein
MEYHEQLVSLLMKMSSQMEIQLGFTEARVMKTSLRLPGSSVGIVIRSSSPYTHAYKLRPNLHEYFIAESTGYLSMSKRKFTDVLEDIAVSLFRVKVTINSIG